MGNFIGAIGGLLMISLIIVLFLKLLSDFVNEQIGVFFKKNAKFIITILLLGIFQLMIAALIMSFAHGNVSVFQLEQIWNAAPVGETMSFLENFSFSEIFQNGRFPFFYIFAHFLSVLLFHQVEATSLYIALISGIVTFTCLKVILERDSKIEKSKLQQVIALTICIPGSFFLFLPSSFSFGIALICLFYCVWNSGKGNIIISGLLSFLCCVTHFWGVITLVTLVVNTVFKRKANDNYEKSDYFITLVSLIILCAFGPFLSSNKLCEYIIPFEIMAVMFYKVIQKNLPYFAQVLLEIMMVSANGFWLMSTLEIIG